MQPFTIGILGDVNETYEPHYIMTKAFRDMQRHIPFQFQWIPTESLIHDAPQTLRLFQGIVAGSGPYRSKDGVIFARESLVVSALDEEGEPEHPHPLIIGFLRAALCR